MQPADQLHAIELSVVVIAYEMRQQVLRTLVTLSPHYQRDLDGVSYEIVVVDNGSRDEPIRSEDLESLGFPVDLVRVQPDEARPSPIAALNAAVAATRGRLLAVILDGACMVTPGILSAGITAQRLAPRVFATAFAWHLGPDLQARSMSVGYGPHSEERVLRDSGWPANGYALFREAAIDPSNPGGWFGPISESRFFVMPRELWDAVGGYEERFQSPGGGLAALDFFRRVAGREDVLVAGLLGEGTFHQVHGGVTTNAHVDRWPEFHEEYERIVGDAWTMPEVDITLMGCLRSDARVWVEAARVADDLGREMRARGAAVPVQGAKLVDAVGVYSDGWVEPRASIAVSLSRNVRAIEVEGWLPGGTPADGTLSVNGDAVVRTTIGPGVFALSADVALAAGDDARIDLMIESEVHGAPADEQRNLSWQVGVVRFMAAFVSAD